MFTQLPIAGLTARKKPHTDNDGPALSVYNGWMFADSYHILQAKIRFHFDNDGPSMSGVRRND